MTSAQRSGSRRIAWEVAGGGTPRDGIAAFTFTEHAAEELQFRVRAHMQHASPDPEDPTLGGMYVGTIHSFCLKVLRELHPDEFHNYDVLDEGARMSLVERGFLEHPRPPRMAVGALRPPHQAHKRGPSESGVTGFGDR